MGNSSSTPTDSGGAMLGGNHIGLEDTSSPDTI